MKTPVTGADGFVGSHLTEALVRAGYHVRAFVLYNSFNSWGGLDHSPPESAKRIYSHATAPQPVKRARMAEAA